MLVLGIPDGKLTELHQLLKMGGDVVRPQVVDVPTLAEMIPLARVRFVDVNTTVPLADQTGTIARPFGTIQAAVDALPAPGGVIVISPGSYPEPSVVIPGTKAVSLVAWSPNGFGTAHNVTVTNSISSSTDLAVYGLTVQNALITSQRLFICNAAVTNVTASNGLRAVESSIANLSAISGPSTLRDTLVSNTCALQAADLENCNFSGATAITATGAVNARFCTFNPQLTFASATLWKCRLGNISTITGALITDLDSISGVLAVLTFGSCTVIGPSAAKVTLSVVVPAVANDQVGYVDVTLVGTKLEGITPVGTLLLANPTADLVAAGAGGGFINVRCSAANTARFAFLGPLAGGVYNFLLGVL